MRENAKSFTERTRGKPKKTQCRTYRYRMGWTARISECPQFLRLQSSREDWAEANLAVGRIPIRIPDKINLREIGKVLTQRLRDARTRLRKSLIKREKAIELADAQYAKEKAEIESEFNKSKNS